MSKQDKDGKRNKSKKKDNRADTTISLSSISNNFKEQNDQVIGQEDDLIQLPKLSKKTYEKELQHLQIELVKLQEWIKQEGLKVVILFEGRDAAGKGGAIKSITQSLNPRICRVVALGKPSDQERTQWYFQRYTAELPAAGEMVLFDRSWYNRAGVEHVMGYCSHEEYVEFLRSCPEFENMLQRSGIILIKYWFSVSDNEQEKRFSDRIKDPRKRWKFSPMDLEARARWVEYSKAKDDMFNATDTKLSPWYVIDGDDKRRARLNCINHLLAKIAYEDVLPKPFELPPLQNKMVYVRPPIYLQNFIPDVTAHLE
ncbi:polyphosphate kinase 2 [Pseudanabaena sp. ABRG5-3]|uniref:polyphosphate kinase 2 n=1 Tax=Pseudanabaena sp. ABRG5-3 TaxID=685565 RepID=UPI000DC702E0|nr:polyphosphate kinase 2 [Pseudanabaena sp. ABRG5-3]BBC26235.1 polyphosphate kinase 2 [Pseudanabaena sp. ABRG5-3]